MRTFGWVAVGSIAYLSGCISVKSVPEPPFSPAGELRFLNKSAVKGDAGPRPDPERRFGPRVSPESIRFLLAEEHTADAEIMVCGDELRTETQEAVYYITKDISETEADALNALRTLIAERGLHGMYSVRCERHREEVRLSWCSGVGFVCH